MADQYTKAILTVIAFALCAITAKLYLPAANRIGPHIGAPTRGDLFALMTNKNSPKGAFLELNSDIPLAWIQGGEAEISGGQVEVSGTVSIEGQ